jgi:hypothetical protein
MQVCDRYPDICERFDRFWSGADTDRPLLYLTAPREDPDRSVSAPSWGDPRDRVLPENMVAQARYQLARTAYLAEGYPHFFVNFGPGILHACIGGDPDLSSADTTWFPRFLADISEFTTLSFQPEGFWWRSIMSATDALLDELGAELVLSLTDIGGVADVLASAVGREQFLMDVIERPETVSAAVDHCHKLWMEAFEANYAAFSGRQDVMTTWWPILSRGRTYMTQCDLNSMISPQAFETLFVGELAQTFSALDHGAYHLDGIGTEVQVPTLLIQQRLRCIQWVPAPGTGPLAHAKMLREIQDAGVSITFGIKVEEVEEACRVFDIRRLLLSVDCWSEAHARQLIEDTLRWCE